MPYGIVVVDKNGVATNKHLKSVEQLNEIHKKCSSSRSSSEEYSKLTTWIISDEKKTVYIDLYGKTDGKAGFENKYDLPPPVDKVLLFNSFALVKYTKINGEMCLESLTTEAWKKYYEKLMGGFEEVNSEDENEEDELENIPQKFKTKNGYLKDGFVVENDEIDEIDDDSETEQNADEDDGSDTEDDGVTEKLSDESDNDTDDIAFDEDENELTYEDYSDSCSDES